LPLPAESLEAQRAALAQVGWDEQDLGLLGRKIRALLKAAPADFAAEARKQGLIPLRLLMILPASTASHPTNALIATAIRFGFLIQVAVAEYEEPESWRHATATH
jgi:hypothetical protein